MSRGDETILPFDLEDEDDTFMDLVERLSPDWRRVVGRLLYRVADVEEAEGETAALSLIDAIALIVTNPETTH